MTSQDKNMNSTQQQHPEGLQAEWVRRTLPLMLSQREGAAIAGCSQTQIWFFLRGEARLDAEQLDALMVAIERKLKDVAERLAAATAAAGDEVTSTRQSGRDAE
jgi:hypothetical protein